MVDVYGLHKPEQGMPEGSFPSPMNPPGCRPHCWVRTPEFPRCLLRLPTDTPCRGRPASHHFHYFLWVLLLHKKVVWVEEHGGHLPMVYAV
jgi:hypothetical protein